MNRRILGAALAMGALLAGQQATQTQPTAKNIEDVATSVEQAKQHKSTPAKQQAPAPAQREVTVATRPLPMGAPMHYFIEKPHLRKVKYGKRRWVIV
jgi:hypothetical protein